MLKLVSFDGAKLLIKFQTTKLSRNKYATKMHQKLAKIKNRQKDLKLCNVLYINYISLFLFEMIFFILPLPTLYFVGFYVLLLFDIVINIQYNDLSAITQDSQTMAEYIKNGFFSCGYLMAASVVALKCLNLVPDLAAWMIPEGDTAFSTRNFGEGVASQMKGELSGIQRKLSPI